MLVSSEAVCIGRGHRLGSARMVVGVVCDTRQCRLISWAMPTDVRLEVALLISTSRAHDCWSHTRCFNWSLRRGNKKLKQVENSLK